MFISPGAQNTHLVDAIPAAPVPVTLVGAGPMIVVVGREDITVPVWLSVARLGNANGRASLPLRTTRRSPYRRRQRARFVQRLRSSSPGRTTR
jgi:hypothetical protein